MMREIKRIILVANDKSLYFALMYKMNETSMRDENRSLDFLNPPCPRKPDLWRRLRAFVGISDYKNQGVGLLKRRSKGVDPPRQTKPNMNRKLIPRDNLRKIRASARSDFRGDKTRLIDLPKKRANLLRPPRQTKPSIIRNYLRNKNLCKTTGSREARIAERKEFPLFVLTREACMIVHQRRKGEAIALGPPRQTKPNYEDNLFIIQGLGQTSVAREMRSALDRRNRPWVMRSQALKSEAPKRTGAGISCEAIAAVYNSGRGIVGATGGEFANGSIPIRSRLKGTKFEPAKELEMSVSAPERVEAGMSEAERAKQLKQAEELLFSGPNRQGFAKALFRGEFQGDSLFPYPELPPKMRETVDQAVAAVQAFADERIDAEAIDRLADIPQEVVEGLGNLGVLGMTAPVENGGKGFSQSAYCRIMEVLGGHCASTAVFVNAHHSIGIRALVLFGTAEQKTKWLPDLAKGKKLAAFALTEPEAGSDAANVQTTATPTPDGKAFILNGEKRYITNGAIADVLTVMARTPDPQGGDSKVSAFLVTPDSPGFEVVEARMAKCGIRGTATARLAFHDMAVPRENVLGPIGKGLRVALTVLDFGRVTFGASCTGAAKTCLSAATRHAARRRQFGRALNTLELVKKKLAYIAAQTYAMEATTYETAALIDRGADDYMLETAILKVFATESLWQIVYETLQIHGGQGYFTNEPYERMMRDARINQIGEGANEVLKAFIALVGMREVGEGFKETLASLKRPTKALPALWRFGSERVSRVFHTPEVPVVTWELRPSAVGLAKRVNRFAWTIDRTLSRYRESVLERQYVQERIADAAISLVTSACVLARLDRQCSQGAASEWDQSAGGLYVRLALRRFDEAMRGLRENDDEATTWAADATTRRYGG